MASISALVRPHYHIALVRQCQPLILILLQFDSPRKSGGRIPFTLVSRLPPDHKPIYRQSRGHPINLAVILPILRSSYQSCVRHVNLSIITSIPRSSWYSRGHPGILAVILSILRSSCQSLDHHVIPAVVLSVLRLSWYSCGRHVNLLIITSFPRRRESSPSPPTRVCRDAPNAQW